ncbi:MAG: hypothetical protein KatS3mg045_0618 [Bellilinea sp.]|nr:MAG: hypothetical protein KatS3mg045_0618 [Bellilinea sp.]
MDFGLAFSYVFQDKDWLRKVGIVALISLIPILGQLVLIGWSLNITKRVIDRHPEPLPEVDFGGDLGRGFSAFVIGFVYSLPITLFALVFAILDSATRQSSSDAVFTMVTIVSLCFSLFAFVYGIAMAIVLPAAYGNYVAKGNLGAGFALGEVFGLVRANIGAYLIVLLGSFVSGLIAPLGTILCIVGVVLTYTYTVAVMGHFYGQAYNAATQNRAAAVAG